VATQGHPTRSERSQAAGKVNMVLNGRQNGAAQAVVAPRSEGVTIMELREGMCRWPVEGGAKSGHPAAMDQGSQTLILG